MAARAYKTIGCLAVIFSLVLLAGIWHLASNSMIACGFFGACFIFCGTRPCGKLLGAASTAGVGYAAIYWLLRGPFDRDPMVAVLSAGAFLGLGTITVMAWQALWGAAQAAGALRDALVLPAFSFIAGLGMDWANGSALPTYDHLLYAFDGTLLRIAPGETINALYRSFPWIASGASFAYSGLLLFPPLYRGWALYRGRSKGVNIMHAFAIAGVAGFILYQVCPAEGPRYAFGAAFPDHLPDWRTVSLAPYLNAGVHNAIPSMHMAWAFLVLWSAMELGPFAIAAAGTFAGFTALATIGTGEHYLVDLVVSAPLVLAVTAGLRRDILRCTIGLTIVLGWLIYLRSGAFLLCSGATNWMLIAATLGTAVAAERVALWPLRSPLSAPE
ncbi:MAG TPA: phosphatase PAP2 family protein [Bryobacteraceae bacterium]|nr:phosphatase PAP2 family protein [Bryobacteraceae bacterium]